MMMHASTREARLKPEYANLYPGLEPGAWFAAATFADFLVARGRTARSLSDPPQRSLNPEHFEFRGGTTPVDSRDGRTRVSDP